MAEPPGAANAMNVTPAQLRACAATLTARPAELRPIVSAGRIYAASRAAISLRLNNLAVKMPRCMAQYRQDHGEADQKQDRPGRQQHHHNQPPESHH